MANYGKRMVSEPDIAKIGQGGGGTSYEAGTGIDIIDNTISIDTQTVAQKSDLPNEVIANPTLAGTEANLTGLQVGDTKYAVPQGGSSTTLYRHHIQIFKADSSTYNCECIIYADIINNSSTEITSLDTILSTLDAGVTTHYGPRGILANGIIKDGSDFKKIIELRAKLAIPTVLQGIYEDTSNVYVLTSAIDIPTDAEVTDAVYTL